MSIVSKLTESLKLMEEYEPAGFKSFKEQLKTLFQCLNHNGVNYCIIGSQARNCYLKPRATQDLDILCIDDEEEIILLLEDVGLSFKEVGEGQYTLKAAKGNSKIVEYDLLFNIGFDPYSSAVKRARKTKIFGEDAYVAQPIDLCLMWLVSAPYKPSTINRFTHLTSIETLE